MDKEFLAEEIKNAMRAQDKPRLSILRMVKNEVDTKEKDSGETLFGPEVVSALKKVLKQTAETLEGSIKAGTDEARTALLQHQVDMLAGYLPARVTGEELEAVIDRVLANGGFTEKRDMGKAIAAVVAETVGNCDKAEVAKAIGTRLG